MCLYFFEFHIYFLVFAYTYDIWQAFFLGHTVVIIARSSHISPLGSTIIKELDTKPIFLIGSNCAIIFGIVFILNQ